MVATGLSTNRYRRRGPSSLLPPPPRDISPSTSIPTKYYKIVSVFGTGLQYNNSRLVIAPREKLPFCS